MISAKNLIVKPNKHIQYFEYKDIIVIENLSNNNKNIIN